MRILIVVCDLGRGGVQRGARNFARGLAALGNEVLVLTTSGAGDDAEVTSEASPYRVCEVTERTPVPSMVHEFWPDLVQIHAHLLRWDVVGELRRSFPTAMFVEQSIWSRPMPSTRHADIICHQSPWMASAFRARTRFTRTPPVEHVLGNPVDIGRFSGASRGRAVRFRREWNIPADAVVAGRIGQAYEDKWHVCLIDAFRALGPVRPELHLLLVAPPPAILRAVELLTEPLRERVHVVEWLEGDESLLGAYAAMDVFAHAARRGESFGFVLLEAMASGTPVVTLSTPYHDNAQLDWVLDGRAGSVAGSPQHFTDLLDQSVGDTELRRLRGGSGAEYVTRFEAGRICEELLSVVDHHRASGPARRRGGQVQAGPQDLPTPWSRLSEAGLAPTLPVRALLRLRPLLAWTYKGDRVWNEVLRLWLERVEWPHRVSRGDGPVRDDRQALAGEGLRPVGDRIGVVLPTFLRDGPLVVTLQRLAAQTVAPTEVVVVDNAASTSCRSVCERERASLPYTLTYIAAAENGGPAGASTLGIEHFLARADEFDWIARGDDDSPDVGSDHFAQLLTAAGRAHAHRASVGGIGGSGATYDPRTGHLTKPARAASGLVQVDYLATNFFPLFAVAAVREVGGFRDELFFGHDEVEYGLRLRAAGYELYRHEPPGVVRRPFRPSSQLGAATWRRYYGLRNGIVVAKSFGSRRAVWWLTLVALAKPVVRLPKEPRLGWANLQLATRAVLDAHLGRLGRTVEPSVVAGELDRRWAVRPPRSEGPTR